MSAACLIEHVIGFTRQADGLFGRLVLRARWGMGDDLELDTGLVHLLKAAIGEIAEAGVPMRGKTCGHTDHRFGLKVRGPEMLFDRDDFSVCHG